MTPDIKHGLILGLSGFTAAAIGLAILLDPQAFYASYGVLLTPQPNLMSELRAPAANLAALGMIVLSGAVYQRMAQQAATLGATVFLAFAAGRLLSLILDGWPSESILVAFAIEIILGVLCLWVARRRKKADGAHGYGVVDLQKPNFS